MLALFRHKIERSGSSHAILESESRRRKAQKISALLQHKKELTGSTILDIGTGSGNIAHELSMSAKKVVSVDIVDERKEKRGYEFHLVDNEKLPFDTASFDIVITNHVIEHTPNQTMHASEVYRVLKPGGIIYLATPNKFWLTDPHYKLPFISWMPRSLSNAYLKAVQKLKWDIYPLSHFGVKKHFHTARVNNALPQLLNSEAYTTLDSMNSITKILKLLPIAIQNLTQYFSPTLIYLIEKPEVSED